MYRAAAGRIGPLKGYVGTRLSSSIAIARRSSGGLFGWLTGGWSRSLPSPDHPLEDVSLVPSLPDYIEPSKTKITALSNGVKFASESSVSPVASIGLYVNCGSIYETPDTFGISYLLERMAFKTTTNRSHLRVVREVEAIGGNVVASAYRDQMSYTFDALKGYVPEMVELLIDSVRNSAYLDWELEEELQFIKSQRAEASKNPQAFLMEAVHTVGYSGALANPLLAPESAYDRLNGPILEKFVSEHYMAPRIVVAASGVEHEELISAAEPLLSDLPSAPTPEEPKSVYVGGDYRCHADSKKAHFAIAFGFPRGRCNEKDALTLTVLQMLMGGGGSLSAGRPGKGMYSRLYRCLLNEHREIEALSSFNRIYNDTSIFGIQCTTSPNMVPQAVDIAAGELISIAEPGEVDEVQLNRAKQLTKSSFLLESKAGASDMARQVLTHGERKPVDHFLGLIDGVSVKDIVSVANTLLSSQVTFASYGNVLHVPSYDVVSKKFLSK